MTNTIWQDNLFGANIYHKIHGTQYGKANSAHKHGQKITRYLHAITSRY